LCCCIALLLRKRVESDSDQGRARERLASDLNTFGGELGLSHENAGHIAAGMCEIRYITLRKRIEIDREERDRLTVRNRKRGTQRRLVPDRQEHVNFSRRELAIVFFVAFDVRCLDIVECEIPAFLIAEFGHPLEEIRVMWGVSRLHTDKADTQHLWLLLRARLERPKKLKRRRAAEQRDELAPSHSITSSASRRNGSGIVRPSAFAVLRFTTSSNLVGCSTGRSAGRVPCKILCTYPAARRNRSGRLAPYDMRPPATTFSLYWNSPGSRLFARKLM